MLQLDTILSPARSLCRARGISKKRLIETTAGLICADQSGLAASEVCHKLAMREQLGSTALGGGIAIPHCRISNCPAVLAALLTLDAGVDFDAPDGRPVDLLFLLLVPEEACQEHLNILAGLVQLLGNPDFCAQLRAADSNATLYRAAVEFRL